MKNEFKEAMDKFGISNKLAAKLTNRAVATVAGMRINRYALSTSKKSIDRQAVKLAIAYEDYLQASLSELSAYIAKNG
jgi:hypothetical protein